MNSSSVFLSIFRSLGPRVGNDGNCIKIKGFIQVVCKIRGEDVLGGVVGCSYNSCKCYVLYIRMIIVWYVFTMNNNWFFTRFFWHFVGTNFGFFRNSYVYLCLRNSRMSRVLTFSFSLLGMDYLTFPRRLIRFMDSENFPKFSGSFVYLEF
jgi:hypothetical protein